MKAKHIVAILLIACLMSSNTFALAENFDPSRYDTQTLINMQAAINAEIANRQVSAASSLIPAPGFDGEIKFRNLEWGIDADSIIKQLTSEGVFSPKPSIHNDYYIGPWSLDPDVHKVSGAGISAYEYSFADSFKVAGYSLSSASVYCMFDHTADTVDRRSETSHFYKAEMKFEISDGDYAFADLTNKLSSLYGEPITNEKTSGFWSTGGNYHQFESWSSWYGANNTAVYLYHSYDIMDDDQRRTHEELIVSYGKTDSQNELKAVETAIQQEAVNAERERLQESANDTSGL